MTRWKQTVGEHGHRVTVAERADRGGRLVLTWYVDGKPKTEALPMTGRTKAERQLGLEAARLKSARLAGGTTGPTLGETEELVFNRSHGLYPTCSTQHHKEVRAAIRFAVAVWGAGREWSSIRKSDFRALWRARIRELRAAGDTGVRGAEVTTQRVLTVARWLQDEEKIPPECCQPGRYWKKELVKDWKQITGVKHDPEPSRPRHRPEDTTKLIEAARQVDPRFYLMLQLGAELRLGQVRELYRRHVVITEDNPIIEIPSSGQKRGVRVYLTVEQSRALVEAFTEGYLRGAGKDSEDYPLFPGSTGKPVSRTQVRHWFRRAEKIAGIEHVDGRGPYGLRRAGVDGAKRVGADRDALMQFGGWTDTQMPDRVYASAEQDEAARRARDIRAKVRKL